MKQRGLGFAHAGFSMVEVLVALIVISVGLLGIAKMQAVALASTGTAKMRSLAAIEAASLASTMRADRAYWAAVPANLTVTVAGTTVTATDGTLDAAPPGKCASTATICASNQIAAQDLSDWVTSVSALLPGATATINCFIAVANVSPVYCTIQLNWSENVVALGTSTSTTATAAANAAALQGVTQSQYILNVDP